MLAFESADFSQSRADEAAFDWCPLRDVGKIVTGATPSTSESENYGGTIPFIKPTDLNAGYVVCKSQHTLSDVGATKARMLPPMSVLVTCIGATIGKTGLARVACATNQQINAISLSPFVLPEFAYWYLESPVAQEWIKSNASATTLPILNKSRFGELPFPVTEILHQARVVASIETQLSRLEAGVSALKRAQANLKRYRAAVLKAACEGRLNSGATRECKSDWIESSLGEILASIDAGKSFKCEERPPRGGETGVLKVSAVTWGTYDEEESKTCTDPSRIEPRYLVEPGDFLFSRANTIELVGACVIARQTTRRLMLSDKILRFRFSNSVLPLWVLYWLRSAGGRREIERLATGNQESMRNIGQERIRQIRIPLPPLAEQERIVAEVERRLSVVDELEATLAANLRRAARLRQAVLAAAFDPKGR